MGRLRGVGICRQKFIKGDNEKQKKPNNDQLKFLTYKIRLLNRVIGHKTEFHCKLKHILVIEYI